MEVNEYVNQLEHSLQSRFLICSFLDLLVSLFLRNPSSSSCLNSNKYFLNFIWFLILLSLKYSSIFPSFSWERVI